jgi:hypothetical protein
MKRPDSLNVTTVLPSAVWLTLALAAFVVAYVNPFRETAWDDDWAYALAVRHLLDTGHYRLHHWATANMPFQVYWGALFGRLGGCLHSTLRLSTLVLWALGLVAFYLLCREHNVDRQEAAILLLGLFSCPLTIIMSFSFMTDIPYLSCLIIALYLYTRSLRLQRYDVMFAASLAASAAILTRQFGAVLIAGMLLVWISSENRRREAGLFAIGVCLPVMALCWQLWMGLGQPTWATRYHFYCQHSYYSHARGLIWCSVSRPALILQYVAFFALPFTLLPAMKRACNHQDGRFGARAWLAPAAIAGYMLSVSVCSYWSSRRSLMPLLPWNFEGLMDLGRAPRLVLTVLTTTGGSLAASSFLFRYRADWSKLPGDRRLLDFVTGGVILTLLAFWIMADEYLLPLLPYALIVLGLRCAPGFKRHARAVAAVCLMIALTSAVWMRQALARNEAFWKGGEMARRSATPHESLSSSPEWTSYYYFGEFLAQDRARPDVSRFADWLNARARTADLIVVDTPAADPSWTLIGTVSYWPFPFVQRHVYVLKRRS